jgi:thiol-disulfide isomerase/thioredoxin
MNKKFIKMRNFIMLIMIMTGSFAVAQGINQKVWDADLGKKVLVGEVDRQELQQGEFGEYYKEEYDAYEPSPEVVNQIKDILNKGADLKMVVVFGEWCSDSQREVPRFFKLVDELGFQENKIKIYAVNRKKEGVKADLSKYHIEYVPTFIIYENGKERGRIVEAPDNSLETDLLDMLKY